MPIYMDRHYVRGATRHAIENAHDKDLRVQDEYGVRFLTYWFDEERSTTFCLVSSPDENIVSQVHQIAHGDVPHEIIEVETSVVDAFLGRISDPRSDGLHDGSIGPAFRAIMFTDLSDFTSMTVRLGDSAAMDLLRVHNQLIRDALREYGGREVKHTGDGIMASFESIPEAGRCACAMQRTFSDYNTSHFQESMHIRIGLSAGEPVEEHGDLFGASVQLAARICSFAEPDQILLAGIVREHLIASEFQVSELGDVLAKGFDIPTKVHALEWRQMHG